MKHKYSLLSIVSALILFGCSSSYRSMQTPDDVYYSPGVSDDGYVSVRSSNDADRYSSRNDAIEDMQIRRGINNPLYRSSLSFGLGFGTPYSNFGYASPFFSPFSYYSPAFGYSGLFSSPYYFGYGYNPYFGFNYGYDKYIPGYYYNSYNPYNSWGGYGNYYYNNPYYLGGSNVVRDNGPRTGNAGSGRVINSPRTGNAGGANTTLAPIRTMTVPSGGNGIRNGGTDINGRTESVDRRDNNVFRRIFSPSNNRESSSGSSRVSRGSGNNYYTPSSGSSRSSQSEVRMFEPRSSTPPSSSANRSSRSSNSGSNSGPTTAPVRKF